MKLKGLYKKISLFICLAMLCTASIGGGAFAQQDTKVTIDKTYDFDNSSSVPADIDISNTKAPNGRVSIKSEDGNNYMELATTGDTNSRSRIDYALINNITGSLYIEFDFKLGNQYGRMPLELSTDNKSIYPLYIDYRPYNASQGKYTASDGALLVQEQNGSQVEICRRKENVWYNFKSYINLANKTVTTTLTEEGGIPITKTLNLTHERTKYVNLRLSIIDWSMSSSHVHQAGLTSTIAVDNFKVKSYDDMTLEKSVPSSGADDAIPSQTVNLKFNNTIKSISVKLDGTDITSDAQIDSAAGAFSYTPPAENPWLWGSTYTLTGEARDLFGVKYNINQSFTVKQQPEMLIETLGFYDADGIKLSTLKNGTVKAKLRFWQKENASYTSFVSLYKQSGERIEMISLTCDKLDASGSNMPTVKDIPVSVSIPQNTQDTYFIKVYVWKSLSDRTPYAEDVCYGGRILN